MIYTGVETTVRDTLIQDATLQSLMGCNSTTILTQVRIGHITSVTNPSYPLITFNIVSGSTNPSHYTIRALLHVDVWSKDTPDTLQTVYARVRQLINLKLDNLSSQLPLAECREISYSDDLYEPTTRTYHLASIFLIQAINV